jgi:hypothetical protein
LAQLLRCGYLASVWRLDAPTRQLRQLSTHRTALVAAQFRSDTLERTPAAEQKIDGFLSKVLIIIAMG